MSVAPPPAPVLPRPRRPWGVFGVVGIVLVVIGYLAFSSVGNALVYYLTPTELLGRGEAAVGETVRLGGIVEVGSVERVADGERYELYFALSDGDASIPVFTTNAPTASFREGSGAVVHGELRSDGVFVAAEVIVKHDENYEAPPPGAVPSEQTFDPGE